MVAELESSVLGLVVPLSHVFSRLKLKIMCMTVPQFEWRWFRAIGESMSKFVSLSKINGSKLWAVSPKIS